MLSTGGNISDGAATPLEWSVWTAEKPADDIRDLGEHRMTSSPANPRELIGAQAPPPSSAPGMLAIYRNRLHPRLRAPDNGALCWRGFTLGFEMWRQICSSATRGAAYILGLLMLLIEGIFCQFSSL